MSEIVINDLVEELCEDNKRLAKELAFERQLNEMLDKLRQYLMDVRIKCVCNQNKHTFDLTDQLDNHYRQLVNRDKSEDNVLANEELIQIERQLTTTNGHKKTIISQKDISNQTSISSIEPKSTIGSAQQSQPQQPFNVSKRVVWEPVAKRVVKVWDLIKGKEVYKCGENDCDKWFVTKDLIDSHVKSHSMNVTLNTGSNDKVMETSLPEDNIDVNEDDVSIDKNDSLIWIYNRPPEPMVNKTTNKTLCKDKKRRPLIKTVSQPLEPITTDSMDGSLHNDKHVVSVDKSRPMIKTYSRSPKPPIKTSSEASKPTNDKIILGSKRLDINDVSLKDSVPINAIQVNETQYKCNDESCGQVFDSLPAIARHILSVHLVPQSPNKLVTNEQLVSSMNKFVVKFVDNQSNSTSGFEHNLQLVLPTNVSTLENMSNDNEMVIKSYKCQYESCGKVFSNKYHLKDHIDLVHTTDQFVCHYLNCNKVCKNKSALKRHKINDHLTDPNKRYKCREPGCDKVYKRSGSLSSHVFYYHKTHRQHACEWPGCQYTTLNKCSLVSHARTHSQDRPYPCQWPGCDWRFKTKYTCKAHVNSVHLNDTSNVTDKQCKCPVEGCDRVFRTMNCVRNHKSDYHSTGAYPCQWPDCGVISKTNQRLKIHMRSHQTDRPFACQWPGCDYKAKNNGTLKSHAFSHTNDRPYQCQRPECGKWFKSNPSLRLHMKTNHSSQTYPCEWPGCEYTTNNKYAIKVHHSNHTATGDKPYACQWPGCEYKARTVSIVNAHTKLIHKSGQQFVCDWIGCQFKTKHKSYLLDHKRSHGDDRPFACQWPDCGQRFKAKKYLSYHMTVHSSVLYACDWTDCQFKTKYKYFLKKHKSKHK